MGYGNVRRSVMLVGLRLNIVCLFVGKKNWCCCVVVSDVCCYRRGCLWASLFPRSLSLKLSISIYRCRCWYRYRCRCRYRYIDIAVDIDIDVTVDIDIIISMSTSLIDVAVDIDNRSRCRYRYSMLPSTSTISMAISMSSCLLFCLIALFFLLHSPAMRLPSMSPSRNHAARGGQGVPTLFIKFRTWGASSSPHPQHALFF